MFCKIASMIMLVGFLSSFNDHKSKIREGYYFSTFAHAATLYKISSDKIEWYNDNVIKTLGYGKYIIIEADSTIKISYNKIWTSVKQTHDMQFETILKIKWDQKNGFELRDYSYQVASVASDNLRKRVKVGAKIKINF